MEEQKNFKDDSCFLSNNQKADLKLLEVLMPLEDYLHINTLLKQETITREALTEAGDILITNLRRYC